MGVFPLSVLVVEDDPVARHLVVNYLEQHGIQCIVANAQQDIIHFLVEHEPDLVFLDLRLGHDDGQRLLRRIRPCCDVPVIITAGRQLDEMDRVVGLELGADDYLIKPFGLQELLARIRAVLRRVRSGRTTPRRDTGRRRYQFGCWQLDLHTRLLVDSNGVGTALRKGEYDLLVAFLNAPLRPLNREHLLQVTRAQDDVSDRSIDLRVLRLRRKLETDPRAPRIIRTDRGFGYVFALPVKLV